MSEQKVYMPLMVGDWLKGTAGMRAEVRGVYIRLLLHQWDQGFIPAALDDLTLIDPEVGKVWVFLKCKFVEVLPGQLQNAKLEEVRNFWQKQAKNGKKGGRPKQENPNNNPKPNPKANPNHNLHIDIDYDIDIELILNRAFDEIYLDQEPMKWPHLDFKFELETFKNKVRGSPEDYQDRDRNGIRKAFQYQLRNSKGKNGTPKDKSTTHTASLMEGFKRRHGPTPDGGKV